MKARNVFATVASVALATTMVVGLTACKTSASSVKGEEVDKATWEAALKLDAFKEGAVEITYEAKGKKDGKEGTVKVEYTVKSNGSITYIKGTEKYTGVAIENDVKSRNVELYMEGATASREAEEENDGPSGKTVYKKDGKWVEVKDEADFEYIEMAIGMASYAMMPIQYQGSYDDFKYDKDSKGYIKKEVKEGEAKIIAKFVDKKLKAVVYEDGDDEGSSTVGLVYSYGEQKLTMPTVG